MPIPRFTTENTPAVSKNELRCCTLPAVLAPFVIAVVNAALPTYVSSASQSFDSSAVISMLHSTPSWFTVPVTDVDAMVKS